MNVADTTDKSNSKEKPHSFSKSVAERELGKGKVGWCGALVLKYLAYKMRKDGEVINGQRWVRVNTDHIAAQYPYVSRAGIAKAIQRLKAGGALKVGNLNKQVGRPSYDRTCWYHVPDEWANLCEAELRYFLPSIATALDVPAAVIHYNASFWAKEQAAEGKEINVHLSPVKLATLLPFPLRTVKRKLAELKESNLITKTADGYAVNLESEQNSRGSKVDMGVPKVDMGVPKVDMAVPKVDNDSIKSSSCSSFGNTFKTAACGDCFTNNANATNETNEQDVIYDIASRSTLREENETLAELIATFSKADADIFLLTVDQYVARFLNTANSQELDEQFLIADADEAFEHVFPIYRHWFKALGLDTGNRFTRIVYLCALECVVGALAGRLTYERHMHPVPVLRRVSYAFYARLLGREEDNRKQAVADEFDERRESFASIDEAKEADETLAPAEKRRTFIQGLHAMNRVGWLTLGGKLVTDKIVITSTAIKQVERMFEHNPYLTPASLLAVMRKCVAQHEHMPEAPISYRPGIKWHARSAHMLTVFTTCFATVLNDLNMECEGYDVDLERLEEMAA